MPEMDPFLVTINEALKEHKKNKGNFRYCNNYGKPSKQSDDVISRCHPEDPTLGGKISPPPDSFRYDIDRHGRRVLVATVPIQSVYPTRTSSRAGIVDLRAAIKEGQENHALRNGNAKLDRRLPPSQHSQKTNAALPSPEAEQVILHFSENVHIVSQTEKLKLLSGKLSPLPPVQPLAKPNFYQTPIPRLKTNLGVKRANSSQTAKLEVLSGILPPQPAQPAPEPKIFKRAPIYDAKTLDEYQRNASALAAHNQPVARKPLHKQGSYNLLSPSKHPPRPAPPPPSRLPSTTNDIGDKRRTNVPGMVTAAEKKPNDEENKEI